jgi:hypothetical protein
MNEIDFCRLLTRCEQHKDKQDAIRYLLQQETAYSNKYKERLEILSFYLSKQNYSNITHSSRLENIPTVANAPENIRSCILNFKTTFQSRKQQENQSQSVESLKNTNYAQERRELLKTETDENEMLLQEQLASELASRSELLKSNTLQFRNLLKKDALVLEEAEQDLDVNLTRLQKQGNRIQTLTSSTWNTTWLIWLSVIIVMIAFIFTFIFMRFVKKKPIEYHEYDDQNRKLPDQEFKQGWLY